MTEHSLSHIAAAETSAPRLSALLSQDRLERAFVVLTALNIAASLLSERLGAPEPLTLLFNLLAYFFGGTFGVIEGVKSLLEREINVDLLMVLAATGAAIVDQWHEGAILLFLFSLSNVLQNYAMDRSRNAIRALLKLRPDKATVRRGDSETVLPIEALQVGDVVLIKPGERLPVDGEVVGGSSTVDQSAITGESMPVSKQVGDEVYAGTLNQNGSLEVRVARHASESTLSRIIKMVESAQESRAKTQSFMETFEQRYALFVILAVALYIVLPPLLLGVDFNENFYRAMVLITVASPCALVISTPAAILSAIANAARRGILFKGGAYLEQMATIKAVAFDKTGTLTTGKLSLTDVLPNGIARAELLRIVASAESRSEHPIALAILAAAKAEDVPIQAPQDFEAIPGQGIRATLDSARILVGTERLMRAEGLTVPPEIRAACDKLEAEGKSALIAYHSQLGWLGVIGVADTLRPRAAEFVQALRAEGVQKIIILTGDNRRVAEAVAAQVGADEVRAELLPSDKVTAIKALKQTYGKVAMVGDGVNDAPALASASIGIAMGAAGTDVALETADLVLMADDLSRVAYAMRLSRQARRVVMQNIAFSLGVIVVLVVSALGLNLALPLGVIGHEGSTIIVVLNGLRLLTYR
ncbi:MAG: heavy metal translocating P-type ATPase [Anaerolineae bacterium]|nr:heavy metal translocating P-type ATPase [Anaerolineae bacterium]